MADAIETLAAASCGAEKSAPSIGPRGVGGGRALVPALSSFHKAPFKRTGRVILRLGLPRQTATHTVARWIPVLKSADVQ